MTRLFGDPKGAKLLAEIRAVLEKKDVFHTRAPHLVFVCGGPTDGSTRTMREPFLRWAKQHLPDVRTLLAEQAFRQALFHDPPEFVNLATFEKLIAEIADCVIVFPESVGAYAEVGYFSAVGAIRKKTLVVNDFQYQAKESFANLGPIATINDHSLFRDTILIDPRTGQCDFSPVQERLSRMVQSEHRRRFAYGPYNKISYGDRFRVLLELVKIFGTIDLRGIRDAVAVLFQQGVRKDLKLLLSILMAADLIGRKDEFIFPSTRDVRLLEFDNVDIAALSARAREYYQTRFPAAFKRLQHLLP